jgi:hypothetical protein
MKARIDKLLFFSSLIWILSACSGSTGTSEASYNSNSTSEVLVCEGEDAYAYHDHECRGFTECDASSSWISIEEAKAMGRRPCGFCY